MILLFTKTKKIQLFLLHIFIEDFLIMINFKIDYKFELIEYETDNEYFFDNYKTLTGVGMSDISLISDDNLNKVGELIIRQNEKN